MREKKRSSQSKVSHSFWQFLTISRNYFSFVFVFYALIALKFAIYLIFLYYIFYFVLFFYYIFYLLFLFNTLLFRDLGARSSVAHFVGERAREKQVLCNNLWRLLFVVIVGWVSFICILYNLCEQFNCYFLFKHTHIMLFDALNFLWRSCALSQQKKHDKKRLTNFPLSNLTAREFRCDWNG